MDNEGGDCYVAALHLILGDIVTDFGNAQLLLCHGTAVGTGNGIEGVEFGHAWCEYAGDHGFALVLDFANGKSAVIPRDLYYKVGQVKDVYRYDLPTVRIMMHEHRHYGPWEGEFAVPATLQKWS